MKHKQCISVTCPYYRGEEKNTVLCEALAEDTYLRLQFDTKSAMKDYQKITCKSDYCACLLVQALDQKWNYRRGGQNGK